MSLRTWLGSLWSWKPAGEASAWSKPGVLDRGQVGRPQIALDGQGNALAAWHHRGADFKGIYICAIVYHLNFVR